MKRVKILNAIACEYVASGAYGKHNLVNVYAGDILVEHFPARIPLAFYIELMPDRGLPKSIDIAVTENRKKRLELNVDVEFPEGHPGLLILPQMALAMNKDTEVRLVASGEGVRPTTLKRIKISVGPILRA
jgi:hypothetical protein